MVIEWQKPLRAHARHILEEAGYHSFNDPNTGKESFVLRLGRAFYPRYHLYIKLLSGGGVECDLHIDQKQASYEGQQAHSGEYDGPLVEEETQRLMRWLQFYSKVQNGPSS